jgi:hypothetical protein
MAYDSMIFNADSVNCQPIIKTEEMKDGFSCLWAYLYGMLIVESYDVCKGTDRGGQQVCQVRVQA